MTERKHTPGPWVIGEVSTTITANEPVDVNHQHYRGFNTPDANGGYLIAESVVLPANARLIAAAPDMLEALEVLLNATMYKDHPAESDIAIAAIAKAKGDV